MSINLHIFFYNLRGYQVICLKIRKNIFFSELNPENISCNSFVRSQKNRAELIKTQYIVFSGYIFKLNLESDLT